MSEYTIELMIRFLSEKMCEPRWVEQKTEVEIIEKAGLLQRGK